MNKHLIRALQSELKKIDVPSIKWYSKETLLQYYLNKINIKLSNGLVISIRYYLTNECFQLNNLIKHIVQISNEYEIDKMVDNDRENIFTLYIDKGEE